MKKIAKLLLASSMLAALVLACNNGSGLVAHDELDAPDVEAYATASGVIVLEWDAVKDATGYSVSVKKPGQEYFTSDVAISERKPGVNRVVYTYDQADAEYEFRVVANSSVSLMLSGVTEVSVTTPDEEDIADGLAEIALNVTLEKVPADWNWPTGYKVSYPVDLGYKYTGAFIGSNGKPNNDAEAAYKIVDKSEAETKFGYEAFTTIENADGDDILVFDDVLDAPAWSVGKYSYVLCAEPLNTKFGAKKLYVLSSEVSVTPEDINNVFADFANWRLSADEDDGTVVISANLRVTDSIGNTYDMSAPAASKFTVWQKEREYTSVSSNGFSTATASVKWTSLTPDVLKVPTADEAKYKATFAEKASKSVTAGTYVYYGYDYFLTYTDNQGEKVWVSVPFNVWY